MKRTILITAALAALALSLALVPQGRSENAPDKKEPNAFMQLKLRNSELILRGLAVKDYESIESGAQNLVMLSTKAQFQLGDLPGYRDYAETFRSNAQKIVNEAKKKNLDGAALAYVKLTTDCVDCHKHIRKSNEAQN